MEKNNKTQALSKTKDFDFLKKNAQSRAYKWLKLRFVYKDSVFKQAWSLSKKHIPRAVTRNRLKRWTRENTKNTSLTGFYLFIFLNQEPFFYKKLKREEFNYVFKKLMEKLSNKKQ